MTSYIFESPESKEYKKKVFLATLDMLPKELANREKIVSEILDTFLRIEPFDMGRPKMGWIGENDNGEVFSEKGINVFLRPRNLFLLISDIALLLGGLSSQQTWLIPFVAYNIWNHLYSDYHLELTKEQALVIFSLWMNKSANYDIVAEDAFKCVKEHFYANGESIVTYEKFKSLLSDLHSMKCIKINGELIELIEEVEI